MADVRIEAPTVWELVERRAAATPDARFALDEDGRSLTFAEYKDAAEHRRRNGVGEVQNVIVDAGDATK